MKSSCHMSRRTAWRTHVAAFALSLFAFCGMADITRAADAQARPQRIVSMNLCTDELLMRMVDPSRIASITYLSQQPINAPLGLNAIASGLKTNHGLAEEILMQEPDLILADEPVASLDPKTARSVLQYLREATRELGIAVVCNLHQVDYAKEFGDRIVGLSQGRMVFDGAPELLNEDALNAIYSSDVQHQPQSPAEAGIALTAPGAWLPKPMPAVATAGGLQ